MLYKSETQVELRSAVVRESRHFPDEWLKMFSMQCTKDAGGLFEKVLQLCLLLIDISGLSKILDNISVILSTEKYDSYTSLSFSSCISPLKSKSLI